MQQKRLTWTTKKGDRRRLLAFEMQCYRHILKDNWQDHISNNDVRQHVQWEWTVMDRDTMRHEKASAVWP